MAVSGTIRTPRTLLLALDAVPYRVAREAVARGAFGDFHRPAAMIAPFPSLTHPSFSTLFEPFGVDPSWGYEVRYFDVAANRLVGGSPVSYREQVPPWGALVDAPHRGVVAKVSTYVSASMAAMAELDEVVETVLTSEREVVVGYLGATDGFMHLYEDPSLAEFLVQLDARLKRLRCRHDTLRGRPLRIILFSDHGCGRERVHYTGSLRPVLRDAGLQPVEQLVGPRDVVAHTFGIVNYTALFLKDPSLASVAASALAPLPAVDLAAYSTDGRSVEVLARQGRALVRWSVRADGTWYSYADSGGDVLRLAGATSRLAARGRFDADGYAHEDDWMRVSAFATYPDPLRRLADALTGDRVRSRATVLVSLGPGWSWGWRSAFAGGFVRGGRLKGTHGGLDRESSLGLLLVDGTLDEPPRVVRAADALVPFAAAVLGERARPAPDDEDPARRAGSPRPRSAGRSSRSHDAARRGRA